jgi:hypothetical protein
MTGSAKRNRQSAVAANGDHGRAGNDYVLTKQHAAPEILRNSPLIRRRRAGLEVVYQDFTGSGAETAAHIRENGRIVIMFCAFQGPPRIVRLHGHGTVAAPGDPRYSEFLELFLPDILN